MRPGARSLSPQKRVLPVRTDPAPYSSVYENGIRMAGLADWEHLQRERCVVALFPLTTTDAPGTKERKAKPEDTAAEEEQYRSKVLKKLHKRLKLQEASIASLETKIAANESKASQIFLN